MVSWSFAHVGVLVLLLKVTSTFSIICCSFEIQQLQPIQLLIFSICSRFVLDLFLCSSVCSSVCHQVTREEYLWLTASADHSNHPDKVVQGRRAMAMLDLDRNLRAVESQVGYVAEYYQMVPEDCTPKNQILVGRLGKKGGGDLVG